MNMKRIALSLWLLVSSLSMLTVPAALADTQASTKASILQTQVVPYLIANDCSDGSASISELLADTRELLSTTDSLLESTQDALSECDSVLESTQDALSECDSVLESTQEELSAADSIIDEAELLLSGTAIPDASSIDAIASRLDLTTKFAGQNPTSPLLDQINLGLIPYLQAALAKLGEFSPIKQIAAGSQHTVVLLENGTVYATGQNGNGQLGNGTTTSSNVFTKMTDNNSDIVAIAAGQSFTIVLKSDGTVWGTGLNVEGQLGDGTITPSFRTVLAPMTTNNSDIVAIAAGTFHTVVLKSNGTVYGTGSNNAGQLGIGSSGAGNRSTTLVLMATAANADIVAIAAGGSHTLALKSDGTVYGTGSNGLGQLGDGTITTPRTLLTAMTVNNSNIAAIGAGSGHSLALKSNGTVYATGDNSSGQLGTGTLTLTFTNVLIPMTTNNSNIKAISTDAAGNFTVALKADGTAYATGSNSSGQLGIGVTGGTFDTLQQMTTNNTNIIALAAGSVFTSLLKSDGTAYGTGENSFGELGIGTNSDVNVLTEAVPFLSIGA